MARRAIRLPTLRTLGIAGVVAGVIGLVAPLGFRSGPPFATIDAPAAGVLVGRCFVAKGRVDPATIRRPLWLLKAETGEHWREVGRVYPPPGTWGSRVCVSGDQLTGVRLALVLADDELDARLAGPPVKEPEPEIPDWMTRRYDMEQQGGRGRRHGFPSLPVGATPIAVVDVRVAGGDRVTPIWAFKGPFTLPTPDRDDTRPKRRHAVGAHRSRATER